MTDKQFVRAWIKALRSGKFKQARNKLKHGDGYCCLGVACVVKARQTKKGVTAFTGGNSSLDAAAYAGSWMDKLLEPTEIFGQSKLSAMNDFEGKSFKEIAAYLESKFFPEKVNRPLEDRIVRYINKHLVECVGCDITVRQVASAIKVNNADIVANIGGKVFIYESSSKTKSALSNQRVGVKKAFKKEGL